MTRHHLPAIAGLAVALLLPGPAAAEPAVIAVFEAVARAEPSPSAAPLQTLVEGTGVTVSEEGQDGWRRIRLTGGGTGWIEERAISFPGRAGAPANRAETSPTAPPGAVAPAAPALPPAAPTPALATGPTVPPPTPDLRAHVYVKDLDHLAELVRGDPVAGPKARRLAERRTTAYTVLGVGLATSAALSVYGISQMGQHTDPADPDFGKFGGGQGALVGGVVTALVATVAAVAIGPDRGDLLDVVNAWNVGHPDQPFTIGEHAVRR